jgi:hypothetical protein
LEIDETKCKLQKQNIEWETFDTSNFPNPQFDSKGYFHLPKEFLVGSGLEEKSILVYPRESFKEERKFLEDRALSNKMFGWVLGPPGTGKSICAFSYMLDLISRGWVATWFHLSSMEIDCLQIIGHTKMILRSKRIDDVLSDILSFGNQHIVMLVDHQDTCLDIIHKKSLTT